MDALRQRREEVALDDVHTAGDAVCFPVEGGELEGARRDVERVHRRVGAGGGERDGYGAAAASDVGDAGGGDTLDEAEGLLDERLGVGAGDEDAGADGDVDAVELALAHQVGDGLVGEAAGEEGAGAVSAAGGRGLAEGGVEPDAVEVEGGHPDEVGLEAGVGDAGGLEAAGRPADEIAERGERRAQAALSSPPSASRRVCSSCSRASTSPSSCPAPFMISWRPWTVMPMR